MSTQPPFSSWIFLKLCICLCFCDLCPIRGKSLFPVCRGCASDDLAEPPGIIAEIVKSAGKCDTTDGGVFVFQALAAFLDSHLLDIGEGRHTHDFCEASAEMAFTHVSLFSQIRESEFRSILFVYEFNDVAYFIQIASSGSAGTAGIPAVLAKYAP